VYRNRSALRGQRTRSTSVGQTSCRSARAVSVVLVDRPTVDLHRTDSALCR
jgi:hypothetical protein